MSREEAGLATVVDTVTPAATQPPIVFQRRASKWNRRLAEVAAALGVTPVRIGGASIEFIDALRAEMIVRNGEALRLLHAKEAAHDRARKHRERDGTGEGQPGPWLRAMRRAPRAIRVSAYRVKSELIRWGQMLGPAPNIESFMRFDVLFVPRLADHLADALPVAAALRDHFGIGSVFGLSDRPAQRTVSAAGFAAVNIFNWIRVTDTSAWVLPRQLLQAMDGVFASAGDGVDLSSEEIAALRVSTRQVLRENLKEMVRVALALDRLVTYLQPSIVLTGNPYTLLGRVASMVAVSRGVRTATMEHGTIFLDDIRWEGCSLDRIFVRGEVSRRALLSSGVASERVSITGAPRMDALFRQRAVYLDDRPADSDSMILVATSGAGDQVSLDQHLAFIRLLYEASALTPEVRWVVKLHPKDRREYYQTVPMPRGSINIVDSERQRRGVDIFDYLRKSRALVTVRSTAALDAMAVGVPVIAVQLPATGSGRSDLEFLERGCTVRVRTAEELAQAAARAWRGESDERVERATREYVAEHYAHPGEAALRVAAQMAALIRSVPNPDPVS